MISVLEVLENALYNLKNGTLPMQKAMGISQLENAISQLEGNPDVDADFIEGGGDEPIEYCSCEIPDKYTIVGTCRKCHKPISEGGGEVDEEDYKEKQEEK